MTDRKDRCETCRYWANLQEPDGPYVIFMLSGGGGMEGFDANTCTATDGPYSDRLTVSHGYCDRHVA